LCFYGPHQSSPSSNPKKHPLLRKSFLPADLVIC
jgi:hypothetical protein